MTEELLYAPNGSVTGVRHAWTFDDIFLRFRCPGTGAKNQRHIHAGGARAARPGQLESLKEYAYFTYAKVNGKRQKDAFADPVDYWLGYNPKDTALTLHFTLPFKKPIKAEKLDLEIYDPEFFIDFGFADKEPLRLLGAPGRCTAAVEKPHESFPATLRFDRSLLTSEANKGTGASFSNRISVTCP
jgi:ABC-type uncharacterized transport system substrate-binding protein